MATFTPATVRYEEAILKFCAIAIEYIDSALTPKGSLFRARKIDDILATLSFYVSPASRDVTDIKTAISGFCGAASSYIRSTTGQKAENRAKSVDAVLRTVYSDPAALKCYAPTTYNPKTGKCE